MFFVKYEGVCPRLPFLKYNFMESVKHYAKPNAIIDVVIKHTSANPFEMVHTRKREYSESRQILFYALRKYTNMGYAAIGKMLGKHYATVIHGSKKIEDLLFYDTEIQKIVSRIHIDVMNNMPLIKETYRSPLDELMKQKRFTYALVNRVINLMGTIKSIPIETRRKYFGDDKLICPPEQEDSGVGVV